jgi:negative regulator of sigma E activity
MTEYKDPMEMLSAFLDGEDVDPGDLANALADRAARETLRDFALVRAGVLEDQDRPGSAFYERMERVLAKDRRATSWWGRAVAVPVPALAAILVLSALLAGWAGLQRLTYQPPVERPPKPDRVLEFVEGVDWIRKG